MTEENQIELPLYETFMELMQLEKDQPHRSVDPDSYLLLIDTLRKGYMLNSKEELILFCKKLWLKPFHINNSVINEKVLESILVKNLDKYGQAKPVTTPGPPKEAPAAQNTDSGKKKDPGDTNPEKEDPGPLAGNGEPGSADLPQPSKKTSLVLSIEESNTGSSIANQDYSALFNNRNYYFNYEYLPVSRRFIEQTIRSLRYKLKGIGNPVIDIETTVEQTATRGYFEDWTMREEDGFVTRWTLLLDHDGSMVAFQTLLDAIVEAAIRGTIKNEGDTFYFRNVISGLLYNNPSRTQSVSFKQFAGGPRRNILIVSDAGAARGYRNIDRIQDTYSMLYALRNHRIAWMNPMPKERWKNTSAADISAFVNMFETGDDYSDNLGNIVQLFKSKLITRSPNLSW